MFKAFVRFTNIIKRKTLTVWCDERSIVYSEKMTDVCANKGKLVKTDGFKGFISLGSIKRY